MKFMRFGLLSALLLCAGCATPDFRPYAGEGTMTHGLGGEHVRKEGIDVYTNGSPDRPFQLLGVVKLRGRRGETDETLLRRCLAIAREQHGQAVILTDLDRRFLVTELRNHSSSSRSYLRASIVRYTHGG